MKTLINRDVNTKWQAYIQAIFYNIEYGVFIILSQNIIYFWPQYRYGFSFPWDFGLTPHAIVSWWMSFPGLWAPDWIGVVALGYPSSLATLLPQYNPVFILLKAAGFDYSFELATYVQTWHAFLGACGALVLGRCVGLDRWPAAVLAVCYQGFGGFYSHSSHPDYFRSFSFVPWYSLLFFPRPRFMSGLKYITVYYCAIPIGIYMQLVSGYVGVTIVASIIVPLMSTNLKRALDGRTTAQRLTELAAVGSAFICSGIYWYPLIMQNEEFLRSTDISRIKRHYLNLSDLQGLITKIEYIDDRHDITMRGLFVSSIVVSTIIYTYRKSHHDNTTIKLILFSLLSTEAGNTALQKIVPWAGLSRFPIADWSPFWCLGLLITFARCINHSSHRVIVVSLIGIITISISLSAYITYVVSLVMWRLWSRQRDTQSSSEMRSIYAVTLICLLFGDWLRVHGGAGYIYMKEGVQFYDNAVNSARGDARQNMEAEIKGCRPSRVDVRGSDFDHFSWRGLYSGEFMMEDYAGGMNLKRNRHIIDNDTLSQIIKAPWNVQAGSDTRIVVTCVSYSNATISWELKIDKDDIVVENEIYYPGWSAKSVNQTGKKETWNSIDVGGFRGYQIKKGEYVIMERFRDPYRQDGLNIAKVGIGAWIVAIFCSVIDLRGGTIRSESD